MFELLLLPFFIIALFTGATHGRFCKAICSNKWISLLGGACYSYYLTHLQIMTLATEILSPHIPKISVVFQIMIYAAVELPLVLVGGLCSYSFFERPFMRIRAFARPTKSNIGDGELDIDKGILVDLTARKAAEEWFRSQGSRLGNLSLAGRAVRPSKGK